LKIQRPQQEKRHLPVSKEEEEEEEEEEAAVAIYQATRKLQGNYGEVKEAYLKYLPCRLLEKSHLPHRSTLLEPS